MNARERWQALQARLTAARAFGAAGDRASALREIDAALELDPNFLAAHSLREQLLAEPVAAPVPPMIKPPAPPAATDGYAIFEQRAKRRRVDRKLESARSALARRQLREAAAALDEIIELDPNLPELPSLTAQFDDLRRGTVVRHNGPLVAAAAVFAAVVLGATWLEHVRPMRLLARQTATVAPLVQPSQPLPIAEPVTIEAPEAESAEPETRVAAAATSGVRPTEPLRSPIVEREPPRSADVRTDPPAGDPPDAFSAPRPAPVTTTPAVSEAAMILPPPSPSVTPPPSRPAADPIVIPPVLQAAPSAPMAAAVAPAAVVRNDETLVRQALQRYRSAYEGLDAPSARAVYPAVNEAALARAFDELESQRLTFESCDVQMRGDAATATCRGTARYVPKVGSREPRTEPRKWTFSLRRAGTDWKIENARAER